MAVFTLTAVAGAPGVTTSALALTFAWPRDVVLVDADRAASQAVVSGYLAGRASDGRGLTSVAQAYRDGEDLGTGLTDHMIPLPEPGAARRGDNWRRWFMPGFSRPGSARLFEPVWSELAAALVDLDRAGTDVIVDAGRWGASGPPSALLAVSRCLVIVTRSSLRALAALNVYMGDIGTHVPGDPLLLVVGAGHPYGGAEIGRHFGWSVRELPWQPDDATWLSDGRPTRPRAASRPLARAAGDTATHLRGIAQQWDAQLSRTEACYA